MKNPDLTTIGNIVVSVAALAAMTALLVTKSIDLTVAGYFLAFVAALNGFTGALLAPSPKQGDQIAQVVAASTPQVPLVNITHPATTAPNIQVSSAALPPPAQQQGPQPITFPQPTAGPATTYAPPQQQTQPQGPAVTSAQGQVIPFPGGQQQQPGQDWRNWTAMTQVPPPTQQQ